MKKLYVFALLLFCSHSNFAQYTFVSQQNNPRMFGDGFGMVLMPATDSVFFEFELFKTSNDWQSSESVGLFEGNVFFSLSEYHMFNENDGLVYGYFSNSNFAKRTIDGGETWTDLTNESNFIAGMHNDIDFIQPNLIYVISTDNDLQNYYLQKLHPECVEVLYDLSNLEGNTSNDFTFEDYRFDFLNSNYGFLSKEDESGQTRIFKSTNDGYDWEMVYGPFEGSLNDIHVHNENQIFACGKEGLYLHSADGGISWTQTTIGSEDWNVLNFKDSEEGFIAGELGNVRRSIDAGLSWQIEETGTMGNIQNIDITALGTVYISGHDFLYKRSPISSLTESVLEHLIQISPNPATNYIRISSHLPFNAIKWEVIDLNGRIVESGSENMIDITKLDAGTYLWKGILKEEQIVYKFIKN